MRGGYVFITVCLSEEKIYKINSEKKWNMLNLLLYLHGVRDDKQIVKYHMQWNEKAQYPCNA